MGRNSSSSDSVKGAGSLRLPLQPIQLDPGEGIVRGPDLNLPRVAVHDPVQRDACFLVAPALGEAVVARGRGTQHLGDQEEVANGAQTAGSL